MLVDNWKLLKLCILISFFVTVSSVHIWQCLFICCFIYLHFTVYKCMNKFVEMYENVGLNCFTFNWFLYKRFNMSFIPQILFIELLNTLFVFVTVPSYLTKKLLFYCELFPTHFKSTTCFYPVWNFKVYVIPRDINAIYPPWRPDCRLSCTGAINLFY